MYHTQANLARLGYAILRVTRAQWPRGTYRSRDFDMEVECRSVLTTELATDKLSRIGYCCCLRHCDWTGTEYRGSGRHGNCHCTCMQARGNALALGSSLFSSTTTLLVIYHNADEAKQASDCCCW